MRVLILSQYFWPESFRITEVAQALGEAGCKVTVLTGQPNYPDGKIFPGYRSMSTRRESVAGCEVVRVPLVPRGRANAVRLMANYFSFVIAGSVVGPWLLRGRKFDAILVYGISPPLQAIPGMVLRWTTGGRLVLWVQDLWPQNLEATGFVRSPRLLRAAAAMVRWIYRHCDLLLAQSIGFIGEIRKLCGSTAVEYHPNPGELNVVAQATGATALRLLPGFNIVFAGNLGTLQALDTILAAAELLRTEHEVRFVMIGSGSRGEWLRREVERLSLQNVQMAGRFSPEQMPAILAQASALLVSLARDDTVSLTIPSKVQSYLRAGKPIIAALDGEGARVVREAKAGVACAAEDPVALARAIRDLRALPEDELQRLGENGRQYYQAHFEPRMLAVRLVQRLETLRTARKEVAAEHG
jgi:glycosyltransferase involved in cell wall biosynthesis